MRLESVEAIVLELERREVRYLVVGGLAVIAHGYVRFTADVDIVMDPSTDNLRRAVEALAVLDYRPRAPVPITDYVDAANRRQWASEKGIRVFSLFSPKHPETEVDLFLDPPFDFGPVFDRAVRQRITDRVEAWVVGYEDLVALKREAGRPLDEEDLRRLQWVREPGEGDA